MKVYWIAIAFIFSATLMLSTQGTNAMEQVNFQFRDLSGHPTIESICRTYGFKPEEIDTEFGIIETDKGIYTIQVDAASKSRIEPTLKGDDPAVGFFARGKVQPFGRAAERLRQFEEARGDTPVETSKDEDRRKKPEGTAE